MSVTTDQLIELTNRLKQAMSDLENSKLELKKVMTEVDNRVLRTHTDSPAHIVEKLHSTIGARVTGER